MQDYIKHGQITEKELLLLLKDVERYRDRAETGTVARLSNSKSYQTDSRICKVFFPRPSEFFNTFNILQSVIAMEYIGTGLNVTDVAEIQYAKYETGGLFDWHQDALKTEGKPRGLTFSINLSGEDEYTGGELLVRKQDKKIDKLNKKPGSYIVFPSFLHHKACEVISGTREAIVVWIHFTLEEIQITKKWVESGTLS